MSTVPSHLKTDILLLPTPLPLLPGVTLEHALRNRRSTRAFRPDCLSWEMLSALLWCGFGCNRHDSGGKTAPSAHNWQEVEVYAVMAEGSYRYHARDHSLLLVTNEDLRGLTGTQDFVAAAPLNLVYVSDFARMPDCRAEHRTFFAGADAAFIAQNVYLFCAGAGLATVVRALLDRQSLAAALGLSITERISLAQTVGHPAENLPAEAVQRR